MLSHNIGMKMPKLEENAKYQILQKRQDELDKRMYSIVGERIQQHMSGLFDDALRIVTVESNEHKVMSVFQDMIADLVEYADLLVTEVDADEVVAILQECYQVRIKLFFLVEDLPVPSAISVAFPAVRDFFATWLSKVRTIVFADPYLVATHDFDEASDSLVQIDGKTVIDKGNELHISIHDAFTETLTIYIDYSKLRESALQEPVATIPSAQETAAAEQDHGGDRTSEKSDNNNTQSLPIDYDQIRHMIDDAVTSAMAKIPNLRIVENVQAPPSEIASKSKNGEDENEELDDSAEAIVVDMMNNDGESDDDDSEDGGDDEEEENGLRYDPFQIPGYGFVGRPMPAVGHAYANSHDDDIDLPGYRLEDDDNQQLDDEDDDDEEDMDSHEDYIEE